MKGKPLDNKIVCADCGKYYHDKRVKDHKELHADLVKSKEYPGLFYYEDVCEAVELLRSWVKDQILPESKGGTQEFWLDTINRCFPDISKPNNQEHHAPTEQTAP